MALCWSNALFLLFIISTHANATTTLPTELATFVPSCARDCFQSFLDTNYGSTACDKTRSLDCLCRTKSKSGYTIGEGAVQCILSAQSVGTCTTDETKGKVFSRIGSLKASINVGIDSAIQAYVMCDGKDKALPNTHATLTATLVVATSMPTSATRTSSKSNFSASTTVTASTTRPSSTTASSLITSTNLVTTSPTNTEVQPTNTANADASAVSQTSRPLTKEQIIGVSVGGSVFGVIAIAGFIFMLCCLRRRKARKARDSDMLPFQLDPSKSNNGFRKIEPKIRGPGGTVNGIAGKVTPQIPPRIDTTSPNMFSRRSIMPAMIGVAVSPDSKFSTEEKERRKSKLLPEKPALSLLMPPPPGKQNNGLSFSQPMPVAQSAVSRQSTATQFEEDFDDSADTAVAADDSWGSSDRTLQPASTGNWKSIRPINPPRPGPAANSAFFVTGGDGNHWRPGQATTTTNAPVAPEYYIKPLNITRGPVGSFSQPRRPDDYPSRTQNLPPHQQQQQSNKPKLQLNTVAKEPDRSSSIYDGRTSLPTSENGRNSNPRPNSLMGSRARRSYKSTGPYDRQQSTGSLTSFETNDSAVVSPEDWGPPNAKPVLTVKTDAERRRTLTGLPLDLSPVVESPPSGRSPVSYPKIPARGRLSQDTIRMVPPPKQPDFSAIFSSGLAGGKSSPITNSPIVVSPIQQTPIEGNMKPWRAAEIQAQRDRERNKMSIEVGMSQGPPQNQQQNQSQNQQKQYPQRLQSLKVGTGQIWPARGNIAPPPPRIQLPRQQGVSRQEYLAPSARFNFVPPPGRSNTQPYNYQDYQNQGPTQYQAYQQPQRQNTAPTNSFTGQNQNQMQRPSQNLNPLSSNPSLTHTRSSSQASFQSQTSTSSSLLAKRRGEQKAQALNLTTGDGQRRGENGKWRVLGQDEIKNAKSEGWRPMTGSNERERESGLGSGDLPRTPGWVPKLTPTRRGDELFLSVQ